MTRRSLLASILLALLPLSANGSRIYRIGRLRILVHKKGIYWFMSETKDLTQHRTVRSVSDLMEALEDEIAAIKSGDLKEKAAGLVLRARGLQIRGAELFLSAARFESKLRTQLPARMGELPIAEVIKPVEIQ